MRRRRQILARIHDAVHVEWIHRLWVRVAGRIGRRGYFLLTLGLVHLNLGWSVLHPASEARRQQNGYAAELIPLADPQASLMIWAMLWWLSGVSCLVNAFRREDRWGFGMATLMTMLWALVNVVAAGDGFSEGLLRAVIWLFIASMVFVISTWPEASPTVKELMAMDADQIRRIMAQGDAHALSVAADAVTEVADHLADMEDQADQRADARAEVRATERATDDGQAATAEREAEHPQRGAER